jgi:hypothetical protein
VSEAGKGAGGAVVAGGAPVSAPGVQVRPLGYSILACVGTAVLTVFTGPGDPGGFTDGLVLPQTWLPSLLLLFLHAVYLLVFGFLLYRVQVLRSGPRVLGVILVGGALAFQAFWNPFLAQAAERAVLEGGAGSALGVAAAGAAVFMVWLTGLAVLLFRNDRVAGFALLPYVVLAFHDFWWAWMLAQLN